MDTKLLKAILTCSNEIEDWKEYNNLFHDNTYVPTSENVFNLLSTALTNIIYCRVSKEAYQRYSVRTNVIETLRAWCSVEPTFQLIHVFRNEEARLKLVKNLIKQHLSTDLIEECINEDTLISLSRALTCLSKDNTDLFCYIEKIIDRLTCLESTDKLNNFLCSILNEDRLIGKLRKPVIENIYLNQKYKLIEETIVDNFMSNNINTQNDRHSDKNADSLINLLQFAATSSVVFGLIFSFLRELFIYLDYSPNVLKYAQTVLKEILIHCEEQNIDDLGLYPRHLHSCVLLIRIKPQYHTPTSKDYTLETLERIHAQSVEEAIILLLHFPEWLQPFSQYVKEKTD